MSGRASTISEDTLADPSLRDELIALGLDPRQRRIGADSDPRSVSTPARNTTGNILDARRGYVAALHLEQAGRWLGGDYNYYEVTAEGRYYRTVASRAVLAVRARIGSIDPLKHDITVRTNRRSRSVCRFTSVTSSVALRTFAAGAASTSLP